MNYNNRYISEDKTTACKIENDPSYYNKLEIAYTYVTELNIKNIVEFTTYSIVLKALNKVTYEDIQSFIRFQNQEYYEYIKELIKPAISKKDFKVIKKTR